MKEIIPKETRLSPIIHFWVLTASPCLDLVVFVRMSLIREDHTVRLFLLPAESITQFGSFSREKPSHPQSQEEREEYWKVRKSPSDQFRIITTAVCPLSPVCCKYEKNCLTGDIYTRILIGHITNISKLSGFLRLLIFILLYKSLYHRTNYCEGPLHAALRNFMWSTMLADCRWLSAPRTMGQ